MRATKAYIASLGTTGILLGASILMLAVVSAVVAFDRWPAGNVSTRVQTLVIEERPAALSISADSNAPSATSDAGTGGPAAAGHADGGGAAPAQVVAGELVTRDGAPGSSGPGAETAPPASSPPDDVASEAGPIIDAISNPDTTTGRVADGTQSFTDGLAGAVGGVNPDVGGLVGGTGNAAAQLLRDLPLRDGLLPSQD